MQRRKKNQSNGIEIHYLVGTKGFEAWLHMPKNNVHSIGMAVGERDKAVDTTDSKGTHRIRKHILLKMSWAVYGNTWKHMCKRGIGKPIVEISRTTRMDSKLAGEFHLRKRKFEGKGQRKLETVCNANKLQYAMNDHQRTSVILKTQNSCMKACKPSENQNIVQIRYYQ